MRSYLTLYIILFFGCSLLANTDSDTLVVGYTSAPPFINVDRGEPYGISIWLWEKAARDIGIPYRLKEMPFKDIVLGLESDQIDVSINPLTISYARSQKILFTLPFFSTNATVAMLKPSGWHRIYDFLLNIFNINFLRIIGGLLFLIATFGMLVWYFEHKENPDHFRPGIRGLWDGLWWSAVTMTTVGYGDKSPKSRGGKLVALIWMFSGIIFISGFTASVASTITTNSIHDNLDELTDLKDRKVGCVRGTSTIEFLNRSLFKNLKHYDNVAEGLIALQKDEINAFLYDEPILKYKINEMEDYDDITLVPIKFNHQFYAFAFNKSHSLLKEEFSRKILEHIESYEYRMLLSEYGLEER